MQPAVIEPKRGIDLGRVTAEVRVQNLDDLRRSERGELVASQVRETRVTALVDSGATFFCLPQDLVVQLGLPFNRMRPTRSISGEIDMPIHGSARIEVQGRSCDVEVMVLPQGRQPLLGQVPLEVLDFWVDLANQRLVGNPEHNGEWMAEAF
jgi:clan AA aspartic protease